MKKVISFIALVMFLSSGVFAQKYITKNGYISFYSSTPVEDIEAHNRQVNAALDISTGDIVFKVLIKSFEFEKALMQEHFNENYMESHKFPNAVFKGKVANAAQISFDKDGEYAAEIEGELTIHGVTNKVSEQGTFTVKDGQIWGMSAFKVLLEDYDIKVPKAVVNNIAESIEIKVDVKLQPLK